MLNLFKASNQWASRPADERFWTVEDLAIACRAYADKSVTATVRFGELRVEARDQDIFLMGKENVPARLTNYSFGQVAGRVKAPPGYLRALSPTLAAQNLNYGLKHNRRGDDFAKMLMHEENGYLARCFTSDKYQRIWNWEIGKQLIHLEDYGWRVPPARPPSGYEGETRIATQDDVLNSKKHGLSISVGDVIAPAGVYASDRDMFVFMVNENAMLNNPASPGVPLSKGFFIWNSEVGDKSFGITTFLYDAVCGNHIVWNVSDVKEFRIRHIGSARGKAFSKLRVQLRRYMDSSVSDDESKLMKCQTYEIAAKKEDVLEALLKFASKKRIQILNEDNINEAMVIAEKNDRYGNPRSPWAISQGITEISQRAEHASSRVKLDRAAGKILDIAF